MDSFELSDEELMVKLQGGDSLALIMLYQRHSNKVWTYLKRRVPPEDVDDLFQDCFVKLVEKKEQWSNQPFVLWLYVVIRNLVADHYRGLKLERKMADARALEKDLSLTLKFEDLIANMPPEVSRLLKEYFQEGWSYKELAQKYDTNEVSLRKRLSRALKLLKKEVK